MLFVKEGETLQFVRWNKAAEELVGLPREAVLGKTDYDLFPKDEADFFTARDRELLAAGRIGGIVQAPIHTAHQGTRILHTRKVPLSDAEGRPTYLLGISEDVTERLLTEEALRLSEERYRRVVEGSLQGILIHQEACIEYINPAGVRMFGYASADDLLGRNIWETLIVPEAQSELQAHPAARLGGEEIPIHRGWQGVRKDGSRLWIESTAITVEWQGCPATVSFLTDITAQREAEAALRTSEARFRDLIEGSIQGIVIHRNLKPLFANQAYAQILGYDTPEDIVRLDSLLPHLASTDRKRVAGYVRTRQAGGEVPQFQEHQVIRKDGAAIWVDVKAREVLWHGERAIQATVYDITERKQAEAALRSSQARLQEQQRREKAQVEAELARIRDQLIAQTRLATLGQVAGTIAHELRNPLGAARNAVYYLRRYVATDNPELAEFLQIIDVEVSAADRIINNLLEMSRAKQPIVQAVDLAQAVVEAFGRLKYPGQVSYACSLEPTPFIVHADPAQFQQVLTNLLSNAVQAMAGQGGDRHYWTP
jgi:PAS domain S-box-containing protein